ncbi:HTH_Tnp_Tc3_2 domain-containing protein [Trichonephila clavipes]|nr:HTH_Tnp_Tc3_2 domain-containing protein [Trichonephila clavipes]
MERRSVVFSDESKFCPGGSNGRVLVRSRPGERLQPKHTGPTPGVMSVDLLPWPVRSPDLSRIERKWDIIG